MRQMLGGYAGRVLHIDLSTQTTSQYMITDDDRQKYLGGKIMAAKIVSDLTPPGVDPLSPDTPLVVMTGPLTGTGAPSSNRFDISTLSPLTGLMASSNCGGSFGFYLKRAGYDGVILVGQSPTPVYIEILEDQVLFHDASGLWGQTTSQTQHTLDQQRKGPSGKIVIGPAGENLVRYAAIFSQERAAGRCGTGAVMGSKKVKAILASGTRNTPVHDPQRLKPVIQKWIARIKKNPLSGHQLPKYGTAGFVRPMNAQKILTTRNFSQGQFEDFEAISGERLAEKYLLKTTGCMSCPIRCGRVVEVDGKPVKGPELETIALLGSNLLNGDLVKIIRWNYILDELGMDTMSAAGSIAFAMELNERGLWDNGLAFGKIEEMESLFHDIAYRKGIGALLADGSKALSKRFGGEDFCIHAKGLELAAYEPRSSVGQGLGYATANRGGCHLNAGYLVLFENLGLRVKPHSHRAKAQLCVLSQNLMEAVSAAGVCLFTLPTLIPSFLLAHPDHWITKAANSILATPLSAFIVGCLNRMPASLLGIHLPGLPHTKALECVLGIKMPLGRLMKIGERGYTLQRAFNISRGVTNQADTLPKRLTQELQDPRNEKTRVPLDQMIQTYYQQRGWNEKGVPPYSLLKKLGLEYGFEGDAS